MRSLYKTDIELLMKDIITSNNFNFVEQFPIRSKYGYIADFANPELKIIIECDGEAWHKEGNAHDRKRDGFLNSSGWIVLRFRGRQIKEQPNICIETIKNYINERRFIENES